MKRADLETLGLNAEQIDAVMKANGKDVETERAKYADYDDVKAQLATANETLDGLKDYDDVKKQVEEYKAKAEQAQKDAAAKVAQLELNGKIKDFTSSKKFVNDFTKNAINSQLFDALQDDANKGKSMDELFTAIVGDGKNVLVDDNKPTPPDMAKMGGKGGEDDDGVLACFRANNPGLDF